MLYAPNALKLIPVKEVPAGAVAEMIGRANDVPLFLRLADTDGKPRILLLGGNYSFQAPEWGVTDAVARVVCEPQDLLFKLNDPDEAADRTQPGMLVLHNGGSSISSRPTQGSYQRLQFDLSTWADFDRNSQHGEVVVYPRWEMGKMDPRGEFNSIFQARRSGESQG